MSEDIFNFSDQGCKQLLKLAMDGNLPREGIEDLAVEHSIDELIGVYWYTHPLLGRYQCRPHPNYITNLNLYQIENPRQIYIHDIPKTADFIGRFQLLDKRYLWYNTRTDWYQVLLDWELPNLLTELIIYYLQAPMKIPSFSYRGDNFRRDSTCINDNPDTWLPVYAFLANRLRFDLPIGYETAEHLQLSTELIFCWYHSELTQRMMRLLN